MCVSSFSVAGTTADSLKNQRINLSQISHQIKHLPLLELNQKLE